MLGNPEFHRQLWLPGIDHKIGLPVELRALCGLSPCMYLGMYVHKLDNSGSLRTIAMDDSNGDADVQTGKLAIAGALRCEDSSSPPSQKTLRLSTGILSRLQRWKSRLIKRIPVGHIRPVIFEALAKDCGSTRT